METFLEKIRSTIAELLEKRLYKSALFWADKAASLSMYQACDVYWLTQCMFLTGQFDRAAHIIVKRNLHRKSLAFRHLAGRCYASSKDLHLALNLLDASSLECNQETQKQSSEAENWHGVPDDKDMVAAVHVLKGDIYEAMDVREIAAECYKEALKADLFCYEAFDKLISHHMLRADEEQELIDSFFPSKQCPSTQEEELIRFLYGMKLKKYNKPGKFTIPTGVQGFHDNLDVAASVAERFYYNCQFQASYNITQRTLVSDPYHEACLPLHVALLVESKETNKLFYLAHQLVDKYPQLPISWYAVGCYYLAQKKQDLARRYLLKATLTDKNYSAAWLAYGHSFAAESEHDQAMAAYFTASQLMKGCHLPFLYIGLEYSVTNNTRLAEKFFSTALRICPDDPHVLHEMGVAAFANNEYSEALKFFSGALEQVQRLEEEITVVEWEPLLNNLGHVHRKLKNFELSLQYHHQALSLLPHASGTYTAIGYVYCFLGNYDEAIKYLHKSLSLRRDDAFTSTLLDTVIEQFAMEDDPVFELEPQGGDFLSTSRKSPTLKKSPVTSMTSSNVIHDVTSDVIHDTPLTPAKDNAGSRRESASHTWGTRRSGLRRARPTNPPDTVGGSDDMDLDESMEA